MRQPPISSAVQKTYGSARRGDATKTILITLAVLCGMVFLTCAGVGIFGYYWVKHNFSNLSVTDPTKIRELTSDIVDISLPREFVPTHATSVFGMTTINYQWCP